jgi:hypothetical protein
MKGRGIAGKGGNESGLHARAMQDREDKGITDGRMDEWVEGGIVRRRSAQSKSYV